MSKSLLSHFTKEWRKWFDLFHEQIAFANKKGLICYFKKIYFPYAFDSFSQLSPFLPKSKSLPLLFTKEWPSPITKEQCGQFALFHEWMLFCSFADKWWAICTKKPMSKFPTLVFEPKSKKGDGLSLHWETLYFISGPILS